MAEFFQSASNIHINDSIFIGNYRATGDNILHVLHDQVAPNAILNAGGRADLVRCYPGTRQEVISRIEDWMTSGYLTDRRMFWLSGPAGAGKSSIVQTIAENCIQRRTPMANFFFFRADASRNHLQPLVPTLLHQLLEFYPDMKPWVTNLIMNNTLIFRQSTRDQFMNSLDKAVREIRGDSPDWTPVVLLIDGLDECEVPSGESDSVSKTEQATLIQILHDLVSPPDSPFIALVASRAEPHIQMAFNSTGYFNDSIYPNEDYRPTNDIRLYLVSELAKIRNTHPLGRRADDRDWPSESVIQNILSKSSGQFIYAATVVRFIATSPESPSFSMDIVLGLRVLKKHSPFAELDAIYSFILSRSRHWDKVRVILAFDIMSRSGRTRRRKRGARTTIDRRREGQLPLSLLGYTEHEVESFFSDLISLATVVFGADSTTIHYYHASVTVYGNRKVERNIKMR